MTGSEAVEFFGHKIDTPVITLTPGRELGR